ncbi:type II toxin-antitoxin system VapC family toxin [Aliarcobacter vitoriensis]|uniref:type II toxin-antitoxin system VapC family toxin n=1 Tax=Aliarcobacter vitoriensis TaxID=2011099 RepID=UPI003AB0542E
MIYLDTNILIYAFCKNVDDFEQKKMAQSILRNTIISEELLLSEISLYEFAFVCKKQEEDESVINENLVFLSKYVKSANIYTKVIDFINKSKSYKQSFDSFHIVFADYFSCSKIITFDKGFKKYNKFTKLKIELL